nr:hypothetical protein [Tanacetum cinerariifolium]
LNQHFQEPYKNHQIQLLPIEHSAQVGDIVEFKTAIAQTFLYLRQFLHHSSANSWQWDLQSSGSGNTLHWQWELILPVGTLSWQWECLVYFIPNNMAHEEENHALVADNEVPTEFALMAKSSSSSDNKHGESTSSIMSKPMIKFMKEADYPNVIKTNNTENARKSIVKYAEMYRNISKGNKGKAVKASACWIWRPKQNTTKQGPNCNGVSLTFKKYQYIDTQGMLKILDIDCSWHMTRKLSSEYEPYDGGYVSLGHGGGKITSKGIIKTGKIEFKNVYFVKELKYNLFSVSQICVNKNSVLFTNSECIMLGKDFKLNDDTNLLLRTPRQHNMYSIYLNNIVPYKNLTCLVAKALVDENHLGKFDAKGDEGTSSTNISSTKDVADQAMKKDVSSLRYIALLNCGVSNPNATSKVPSADQVEPAISLTVEYEIPTVSSPVPTVCLDTSPKSSSGSRLISKGIFSQKETPPLGNALTLSNRFEYTFGMEADLSNMETSIPASPTPTFRIHKDHPKSHIIGPVDTPVQTRHKSNEMKEQSLITIIHQKINPKLLWFCLFSCFLSQEEPNKIFDALKDPIYQMDVKSAFLYCTINEEVYVMQPPGFQDPKFPERVYKVEKAIYGLHQLCRKFEALMHDKFQMSAMGELTFFLGLQVLQKKDGIFLSQDKYVGDILKKFGYLDVRSANSPMDKENPWGKDGPGKDVELHLYRSMIGSLKYLTTVIMVVLHTIESQLLEAIVSGKKVDLMAMQKADYYSHFHN